MESILAATEVVGGNKFLGELGGLLALTWAAGAVCGWGFAQKTVVKLANIRLGELKEEIARLRERVLHLENPKP